MSTTSEYGIDYTGGLSAATLKHATVDGHPLTFVCRYLSGFSKDLTPTEARDLSNAGLSIVVVFETTATEAENGRAAGVADAKAAMAEAAKCGMPADRPIYMAVDEDTSVGPHITAYFQGVASVLGLARTGAYGGYRVIKGLFDAGLIRWGWQTYAWSAGQWDSRAHLQQYSNDHTISGAGVDFDRAMTTDYGQWRIGVTPSPQPSEEDMLPGQVHFGDDGKCPIGWPAGAFKAIGFWCDNTFEDVANGVKATDPCKIRVAVRHDDGSWQTQVVTVGNVKGAASQKTVVIFKSAAKANGCSVTRADASTNTISFDAS